MAWAMMRDQTGCDQTGCDRGNRQHGRSRRWLAALAAVTIALWGWLPIAGAWAAPGPAPVLGSVFGSWFAGSRPSNLGATAGQLKPCPGSPNCVNSQALVTDLQHAIAPITFTGEADRAFAKLTELVQATERATVVTAEPTYLYAEFVTPLMGFVDDVEFVLDAPTSQIHVRSASRLGESDLGLNRQRIETLRAQLTQALAIAL